MTSQVHPVDEVLPFGKLTALGLQHVLVMYAGAVAVPLIVGRALNLPPDQVAHLISAARTGVLPATHFRGRDRKLMLVFEHRMVDLVADLRP